MSDQLEWIIVRRLGGQDYHNGAKWITCAVFFGGAKPMIVLLAGMQRSGSTFAFNVAREVLQKRGTTHQESHANIVDVLERGSGADHVILKTHVGDSTAVALARHDACRTICTVRRVEDAVASWITTFGASEEDSIDLMRRWLLFYVKIREHALLVPYELIDRHPWRATLRIARYLDPHAGLRETHAIKTRFAKAEVMRRSNEMSRQDAGIVDVGFSYHDGQTAARQSG